MLPCYFNVQLENSAHWICSKQDSRVMIGFTEDHLFPSQEMNKRSQSSHPVVSSELGCLTLSTKCGAGLKVSLWQKAENWCNIWVFLSVGLEKSEPRILIGVLKFPSHCLTNFKVSSAQQRNSLQILVRFLKHMIKIIKFRALLPKMGRALAQMN